MTGMLSCNVIGKSCDDRRCEVLWHAVNNGVRLILLTAVAYLRLIKVVVTQYQRASLLVLQSNATCSCPNHNDRST
jgi:hypothetical protein